MVLIYKCVRRLHFKTDGFYNQRLHQVVGGDQLVPRRSRTDDVMSARTSVLGAVAKQRHRLELRQRVHVHHLLGAVVVARWHQLVHERNAEQLLLLPTTSSASSGTLLSTKHMEFMYV